MSTKRKEIQVTLQVEPEVLTGLNRYAQREEVSLSAAANHFLRRGLTSLVEESAETALLPQISEGVADLIIPKIVAAVGEAIATEITNQVPVLVGLAGRIARAEEQRARVVSPTTAPIQEASTSVVALNHGETKVLDALVEARRPSTEITSTQLADATGINRVTVRHHLRNIRAKLGIAPEEDITEAARVRGLVADGQETSEGRRHLPPRATLAPARG